MPATEIPHWLHAGALAACVVAGCGGDSASGPAPGAPEACNTVCVSTVAGTGEFGNVDGPAPQARFSFPHAVAVDASGAVHVADYGNDNLTRLLAEGRLSTPAQDDVDFPFPADVAVDAAGNRYEADRYGNRILKFTPAGELSVLAGTGEAGDRDGDGSVATFSLPTGLALAGDVALYVADMGNRKIRRITLRQGN